MLGWCQAKISREGIPMAALNNVLTSRSGTICVKARTGRVSGAVTSIARRSMDNMSKAIKKVRTRTHTSRKLTSRAGRTREAIPDSLARGARTGPMVVLSHHGKATIPEATTRTIRAAPQEPSLSVNARQRTRAPHSNAPRAIKKADRTRG